MLLNGTLRCHVKHVTLLHEMEAQAFMPCCILYVTIQNNGICSQMSWFYHVIYVTDSGRRVTYVTILPSMMVQVMVDNIISSSRTSISQLGTIFTDISTITV